MKLHEIDYLHDTSKKEYPTDVGNNVLLSRLNVKSLQEYNIPEVLKKASIDCAYNQLFDLVGGPKIVDESYRANVNHIMTLDGFPERVGKTFQLETNELSNLKGIHKIVKYIGDRLVLYNNPLKSNMLGIVLIGGLQQVYFDNSKIDIIFNKYLARNAHRDRYTNMLECQQELIEAGLEPFARL